MPWCIMSFAFYVGHCLVIFPLPLSCLYSHLSYQPLVGSVVIETEFNLVEKITVRFLATAIRRGLEPLDDRTEPRTKLNWWWKQRKKKCLSWCWFGCLSWMILVIRWTFGIYGEKVPAKLLALQHQVRSPTYRGSTTPITLGLSFDLRHVSVLEAINLYPYSWFGLWSLCHVIILIPL
jgi:hypothetical protein